MYYFAELSYNNHIRGIEEYSFRFRSQTKHLYHLPVRKHFVPNSYSKNTAQSGVHFPLETTIKSHQSTLCGFNVCICRSPTTPRGAINIQHLSISDILGRGRGRHRANNKNTSGRQVLWPMRGKRLYSNT